MKTRFHTRNDQTSVDNMMTPMIDVVFQLLIFFLTASSFHRLEKLLPSAVSAESQSKAGGQTDEPPKPVESDLSDCIIKIAKNPNGVSYRFNDEAIPTYDGLVARMRSIVQIRPDVPIVIDPADDVLARDAIRVYDAAKGLGSLAVYLVGR